MSHVMISPSILSCDFGKLAEELAKLTTADMLHLDVMDGHYVPNLTFGYPLIEKIRSLSPLPLDVHLMVTNPGDYIDRLAEIGVNWISFHQECSYHSHRLVQQIKSHGIKAGIALNPAVPVSTLESILPDLDFVLLMSVNPGFSGQQFIPSVVTKIEALREIISRQKLNVKIEVDGGVNARNTSVLVTAGADILVSASYIFGSPNYAVAIMTLRQG